MRIFSGNQAIGNNDDEERGVDVAVMDDFIYSEPVLNPAAIPAISPAMLALLVGVIICISALRLRN